MERCAALCGFESELSRSTEFLPHEGYLARHREGKYQSRGTLYKGHLGLPLGIEFVNYRTLQTDKEIPGYMVETPLHWLEARQEASRNAHSQGEASQRRYRRPTV
jgi:hypothetical protein